MEYHLLQCLDSILTQNVESQEIIHVMMVRLIVVCPSAENIRQNTIVGKACVNRESA